MRHIPLLDLFENATARFPSRIAVEEEARRLTYKDLDSHASSLADTLRQLGIGSGDVLGIYLDPSLEYVVSVLAALKVGAVFMPLGPVFPSGWLSSIIQKTKPVAFVTNQALEEDLCRKSKKITTADQPNYLMCFGDTLAFSVKTFPKGAPDVKKDCRTVSSVAATTGSTDGCYIITTSGSTGEPKAILGSERGLSHFIHWEIKELGLDYKVRGSFLSAVTFDVSLRDVWAPLAVGGTLCVPADETRSDGAKLARWLKQKRITLVHIVPTLFRLLTQAIETFHTDDQCVFPALKYALIAGETLYANDVVRWKKASKCQTQLINLYGPSETTLAKLFLRITEKHLVFDESVPLGHPIPDAEVLLINNGRLCKIGEVGEIYIKTPYMSKGYVGDPKMNEKHFIQNPLTDEKDIIYRTGDLGRYLDDMSVKFEGRVDTQIKLRGIRVEIGEIEAHLRRHPGVREAAVVVKEDLSKGTSLIGYVVAEPGRRLSVESLRMFLSDKLPDYMIPATFVNLPSLPLTPSGKIDRASLPMPEAIRPEMETPFIAPSEDLEKRLAEIWCGILEIDRVGVDDNFFDLGGDSLLAVRVINSIKQNLGIEFTVAQFFQNPRIRKLIEHLNDFDSKQLPYQQFKNRANRKRAAFARSRRNIDRMTKI